MVVFLFCFLFLDTGHASELKGGRLVRAVISDPRSFNLVLAKETSTTAIVGNLFEGLTRTDAVTLEVVPNLAKKWVVSSDGKEWTFYLRDDVFWFDGEKFSADDVVFTFNKLIYNPDIPSSSKDIFTIDGNEIIVEKIDAHTVKFILPVKFAPFLRSMSESILPKHILEKNVDDGTFNFTWGTDTDPKKIIGTGPFKLTRYLPGERVILERNPLYWKKDKEGNVLPYLDEIIYIILQSQDTALLKFKDGELDYYGLRGTDYPLLKPEEEKGNFTIYETGPNFGSLFLVLNQNTKINPDTHKTFMDPVRLSWFKDVNFRKAIAHAIDKQMIIEIAMNDLGIAQYSPMSPSSGFFYNPNVTKYEFNPARAKEILKKNGYIDRDGDGFIEDKDGNRIEFQINTNAGSNERIQIASIIRKDFADLGMKVTFLPLEFNNLVQKLTSTYDWDAIVIGLTGGIEPHFGKNVWHSSGHLHMWNPLQEKAETRWERKIDSIFDTAVSELDKNKRKELYDTWQVIVSDNLPVIYTCLSESIFAVRDKFGNLNPTPYGGAFHNLEEIYIKKEGDGPRHHMPIGIDKVDRPQN